MRQNVYDIIKGTSHFNSYSILLEKQMLVTIILNEAFDWVFTYLQGNIELEYPEV